MYMYIKPNQREKQKLKSKGKNNIRSTIMTDRYPQQHEEQQLRYTGSGTLTHHVSGKSMVGWSLAGVAIGGPLFGMMGFSFLATVTLVLVCSLILLLFSPLLLFAVFVFVGAFTGFTAAIAMGVAGFHSFAWIYRQVTVRVLGLVFRGHERVKKEGQDDFVGYLQPRVGENSSQPYEQKNENEPRLVKVE